MYELAQYSRRLGGEVKQAP